MKAKRGKHVTVAWTLDVFIKKGGGEMGGRGKVRKGEGTGGGKRS